MSYTVLRLGCDIGGTFTDFVVLDGKTGELEFSKVLTTPGDPSEAVDQGLITESQTRDARRRLIYLSIAQIPETWRSRLHGRSHDVILLDDSIGPPRC